MVSEMNMDMIAITGASGYIGRHLVKELIRRGNLRIKLLSRTGQYELHAGEGGAGIEVVKGDLCDPGALQALLEPGCVVINLAYLQGGGEAGNLAACATLLAACKTVKIKRLVHCSTAAVVGRISNNIITENTQCQPMTEYGVTKLKIERAILDAAKGCFEATILRPTAVFGSGGENLKTLVEDMFAGSRLRNYLKMCVFGKRRMNLVYVTNVVASLLFLAKCNGSISGEVFNISDSDSPLNNFVDVEHILMRELHIPNYSLPRVPVPSGLLRLLLNLRGRDSTNPRCDYSSDKLFAIGFKRPVSFRSGLVEYATWCRSQHSAPTRLDRS